jgi:hypothetical protein
MPLQRVQVCKLSDNSSGESPTGPIGKGYTVEGALIDEPVIGQPLRVWRDRRNGVYVDGFFTTSPVTHIERLIGLNESHCTLIETESGSVYEIRYLDEVTKR